MACDCEDQEEEIVGMTDDRDGIHDKHDKLRTQCDQACVLVQ